MNYWLKVFREKYNKNKVTLGKRVRGHFQIPLKCEICGLEYVIFTEYDNWEEKINPTCPECGYRNFSKFYYKRFLEKPITYEMGNFQPLEMEMIMGGHQDYKILRNDKFVSISALIPIKDYWSFISEITEKIIKSHRG